MKKKEQKGIACVACEGQKQQSKEGRFGYGLEHRCELVAGFKRNMEGQL